MEDPNSRPPTSLYIVGRKTCEQQVVYYVGVSKAARRCRGPLESVSGPDLRRGTSK
ncbi:unnamed protein product [Chondrus crispus]|uniref:Uncharacterized protein n=1 Tax=Chondrus crispus TaxID=2769 RepID=R7QTA2_CHOCR|nr:unnamed protein product [Chondrus crispus]CDF40741.1 unnamed protein product [Chondrus crispus]|eukprot:XP_005711035.1 unnamed protein product [Chondrus crispus]